MLVTVQLYLATVTMKLVNVIIFIPWHSCLLIKDVNFLLILKQLKNIDFAVCYTFNNLIFQLAMCFCF